ncbi:MAG: DUF72 domain-containing protein [Chthoniobacterales bacterium]
MFYIGISGWTYPGWRGVFYPDDLPQRLELEYASKELRSIEINGTHYGLQRPKSYLSWYERTPKGFRFSVKAHRYITHIKRLSDVEVPIANFFASGVLALREKLGPFLWQFPPSFKYDHKRMEDFFSLLPQTTTAAARLARKNDLGTKDRIWLKPGTHRKLQHCIEIRNPSFMLPEFFTQMRKYNVAFVFADTAKRWPYAEDITGDFIYMRLHGDAKLYVNGYTETALKRWAKRMKSWSEGRQVTDAKTLTSRRLGSRKKKDVYVYFDNDSKVKAPRDAKRLRELLHS